MFTLDQINDIHDRLGKQHTLPEYLKALNAIGVERADTFLSDGHSEFYGQDNHRLIGIPIHEKFIVNTISNKACLLKQLMLHERGKIDYLEMSRGLANCGVEKWSFDTNVLTISYYDMKQQELLVETIG